MTTDELARSHFRRAARRMLALELLMQVDDARCVLGALRHFPDQDV